MAMKFIIPFGNINAISLYSPSSLYFLDPFITLLAPNLTDNSLHLASKEAHMGDLIYIGLTVLFLALTYGFIVVCARLMEEQK